MKKTFKLTDEKIAPARLVEAIKNEVRKYLKRERRRALPVDADYWDFDCKFGATAADSQVIHVKEIDQYINQAEADKLESFYLEILAKPAVRGQASYSDETIEEIDEADDE
ncbi:DUF6172 family protein [Hydrogenovibrio kuenenii]|uniref:DUF6172 family protein n=1 Tax=Hydrogenovibrio kuenenii TaxID=63658 RepID=UPI00046704B3|nr:DUF6172 family protein [Hydrogenovibrio kuenenii]